MTEGSVEGYKVTAADETIFDIDYQEREEFATRINWDRVLLRLGLDHQVRSLGTRLRLCVFHQERTPSLFIGPPGQYHCLGCGKTGDVVDFISRYHFGGRVHNFDDIKDFCSQLPILPNPNQLPLPHFMEN